MDVQPTYATQAQESTLTNATQGRGVVDAGRLGVMLIAHARAWSLVSGVYSFEEAIDTAVIECGLDEYQREDLEVLITRRLTKEPKSPQVNQALNPNLCLNIQGW